MFEVVDRHGFGERVYIKPIREEKVKHMTLRPIKREENENVKRMRELWKNHKKSV